jgi:putative transposase
MARPLRIEWPGAWYHITSRGNERRVIFSDDEERQHFLQLLERQSERFRLRLQAYVLMDNHYHLLLETVESNLSRAMQWLNTSYSQWFNRRHRRVGHLLQGRFGAVLVDWQPWGLEVSRYMHLNPVRVKSRGLDKAARQRQRAGVRKGRGTAEGTLRRRQLREYQWSSYRAHAGLEERPAWLECDRLLSLLGGTSRQEQQRRYRCYVEEALREGLELSPWEQVRGQVVLGGDEYVTAVRERLEGSEKEQVGMRELLGRPSWEQVVQAVEEIKQEKWEAFRDRRGDWGRELVLMLAWEHCGLKLKELAERVGGIDYVTVSAAIGRFCRQVNADASLQRLVNQVTRQVLSIAKI